MESFVRKWSIPILLLLATTLNYLDRQTVSVLAPVIQKEMGIDNEALGLLFSLFYYTYTFAQFGVGLLLDRFSPRWIYGGAVIAWSAVAALTGTANSFAALMGFRLLLGIAESANWPGAIRIISHVLPPRDRAMGNGIFTSGTSIGALIAPGVIIGISSLWGWRWSFVAIGALGLLWFPLWMFASRPLANIETRAQATAPGTAYRRILADRQFWRVFAVTVLVNPILYFFLNWLPTYYQQIHHIPTGARQARILTMTYLGLDFGYLTCGAAVIAMSRLGRSLASARRTVLVGATVLLGLCALTPMQASFDTVVAMLIVCNFAIGVWIAMYLTLAQEVNPEHVSTTAGLLGGSGSLAGAFAMWAVGRHTRITGSFDGPLIAVSVAAVVAAIAGWSATRSSGRG